MLPPPSPSVLTNNPHFATLYAYLTTNILAPDGSTLANAIEHDATVAQLNDARASAVQDELLLRVLEEIASTAMSDQVQDGRIGTGAGRSSQLPRKTTASTNSTLQQTINTTSKPNHTSSLTPELRDLIFNVTAYLSVSLHPDPVNLLPPDTEDLLADDLAAFYSAFPSIAPLLSTHIINTERTLSSLLSPPPPPLHNQTPASPTKPSTSTSPLKPRKPTTHQPPLTTPLSALTTTTTSLTTITLPDTLTTTTTLLSTLLSSHISSLSSRIRTLELQIHGTTARHALSRSTFLATVARGVALKSRILALEREKAVYGDEEVMEGWEGEVERLAGEEASLERRERELEGLLGGYEEEGGRVGVVSGMGKGGGREMGRGSGEEVFRVLGGRYREVEEEIEIVKRDIERLETRVWRGR